MFVLSYGHCGRRWFRGTWSSRDGGAATHTAWLVALPVAPSMGTERIGQPWLLLGLRHWQCPPASLNLPQTAKPKRGRPQRWRLRHMPLSSSVPSQPRKALTVIMIFANLLCWMVVREAREDGPLETVALSLLRRSPCCLRTSMGFSCAPYQGLSRFRNLRPTHHHDRISIGRSGRPRILRLPVRPSSGHCRTFGSPTLTGLLGFPVPVTLYTAGRLATLSI